MYTHPFEEVMSHVAPIRISVISVFVFNQTTANTDNVKMSL